MKPITRYGMVPGSLRPMRTWGENERGLTCAIPETSQSQSNEQPSYRSGKKGQAWVKHGSSRQAGSHATGSVQGESDPKEKRTT